MGSQGDNDASGVRDHALVDMLVGQQLGGFQIERPIGAGGMGTVFRGTQLSIGRTVAVKVVREHVVPNGAERFLREARLISQINHPNVVQLIDFGHRPHDGLMYYAMEHIEGLPLNELIARGRLHPNLVIELMMQTCSALAEAHAAGVVHRDLKASNMLVSVTADGAVRLRVLDFGIAHSFEDTAKLTQTGLLCGTPAYMAPEQARGEEATPRVDLYAVGINLHHMLAGARPFSGLNAITVVLKQVQEPPPDLTVYARRALLPGSLVELTAELLAKDPAVRPGSATEVRRRLAEIRQEQGWDVVELAPAEAKTLLDQWTRPALSREVEADLPARWRIADLVGTTDSIERDAVEKRAERSQPAQSGPIPMRAGGGWSAFNRTPSAKEMGQEAMVLDPVTGEFMSVSAEDAEAARALAPQAQRPAASVPPDVRNPRGRTFSEEELVVDLPPRPTVAPPQPPPVDQGVDVPKLLLIALVVFVLVLGLMFIVTSTADAPPPPDIPVRSTDAIKVEPIEPLEPKQAPEPARPKTTKARPARPAKSRQPKKGEVEVIDVFDDPPTKRTIIIEEGTE